MYVPNHLTAYKSKFRKVGKILYTVTGDQEKATPTQIRFYEAAKAREQKYIAEEKARGEARRKKAIESEVRKAILSLMKYHTHVDLQEISALADKMGYSCQMQSNDLTIPLEIIPSVRKTPKRADTKFKKVLVKAETSKVVRKAVMIKPPVELEDWSN